MSHGRLSVSLGVTLAVAIATMVGAQLPPTGLDRYLCYRSALAQGSLPFASVPKTLEDQFPPAQVFDVKKVMLLCNPADVNGSGIVHSDDHLVTYAIRPASGSPRFQKHTHVVVGPFGTHTVSLQRPDSLLVPSSKTLGGGGAPPYGPADIRHYKCYRAKIVKGTTFQPPPPPTVSDQFRAGHPYSVVKVTKLCTPADKNGEDPTAPADPAHLVCYKVRGAKLPKTLVSINNQIRAERLDVARPNELCVPALKDPGPTTTSTTSTTSTSITTTTFGPCGSAPAPLCWGECPPAAPICQNNGGVCTCVPGSTPCGSTSFPECDGACGVGQACAVSLSGGCTCEFQGIPCAYSYALQGHCGAPCPDGYECVFVSAPDGEGCFCNPIGSTCYGTYPVCDGSCPSGQTCSSFLPGLCMCN